MSVANGCRERWAAGDKAWFEYHCWEDPESGDAEAWYHSHQRVVIVRPNDRPDETDANWSPESTWDDRCEECCPRTYRPARQ